LTYSRAKGLLIDLDGTVYDSGQTIPGAAEAVGELRETGIPLRFLTNTSRSSRVEVLARLGDHGIPADIEEVYTASYGAALWLQSSGVERAAVLVPASALVDFSMVRLDHDHPEVVLVGDMGDEWTFQVLNQAFRWVLQGADLIAIHKNPYWMTPNGITLDAGAFVAALEYATNRTAVTIGKPSSEFFETAAASMGVGLSDVIMIGDDLSTDVAGAKAVGATAVLVRTGKYREEDLTASAVKPDSVVDSIRDLPGLLSL
jgi:HAD superfamily hydrolase (TIGR01458 family)